MVNEALCKILCHNITCLIQSVFELGIEATFWKENEEPEPEPQAPPAPELDETMESLAWM
jgi:hypothetical protein